jgi:hypothetical protein
MNIELFGSANTCANSFTSRITKNEYTHVLSSKPLDSNKQKENSLQYNAD